MVTVMPVGQGDVMVNSAQTGVGATLLGSSFVLPATTTTATCIEAKRTFVPGVNGTYYFMVKINNTGVPWYLGFDDMCVELGPTCVEPTNLTATAVNPTTWNLSWTPGSSEAAWEYSRSSSLCNTTYRTHSSDSVQYNQSNCRGRKYHLPVLCKGVLRRHRYSTWAGPFTFSTPCGAFPLPYTQNFDGVIAPALPACMTVTDDNADLVKWVNTNTTAAKSLPNAMRIGYNSAAAMNDWFFSPALTMGVGTYKVSFLVSRFRHHLS
ncbi:MAG: hypothetical protein IPH45_20985 [Bacteroidales bacterium]|nr:hypothetical protein [Bacteroidales bacterium]